MNPLDRRDLLKEVLLGGAFLAPVCAASGQTPAAAPRITPTPVIDVNVSLFQWPFRRLPFDAVEELVEKLSSLQIGEAWAGSFEGILHRDIGGVNMRLADACRRLGAGRLIPFGSVNPGLPDWEEDLRRCHEELDMPGIRVHPNYHGYTLDDPRFERLLALAAERGLLVQLAAAMEDTRTQHPRVPVPDVDLTPLPALVEWIAKARVLVLNLRPRDELLRRLAATPRIFLDMARVEGTDGVARLLRSIPRDRVVFGSHAPFLIGEAALIRVVESRLTEDETRALLVENARRLVPGRPVL
jgi:predicted TIM-barrel fold metal-dependent hydrolase